MKKSLLLFSLLLLCFTPFTLFASHLAGGEVSYVSVGNNRYVVTIKVFRDCSGIPQSTTSASLSVESTCGFSSFFSLPFVDSSEVSQICPAELANSVCRGGTLPGMQEYIYRDTITLSPDCDYFTLSWTDGSRNGANANLVNPDFENIYVPALLYSQTDSDNSSPYFTSQPIPYFCAGNQVSFGLGVVEQDGDSLVFSLAQPLSGAGTTIAYTGSNTVNNPFPTASGVNIDPQTGQLTFTPTTQGIYTIVVLCTEIDRASGQILGSIRRDIEIVVRSCTNQPVNATGGIITNVTGDAVQINDNTLEMCEGNTFSFTATYDDPNATDILTATISNPLPGLTTSISGTNPLTIVYTWTAPPLSAGTNNILSIQVTDGACPIQGTQFFSYSFNVTPATNLGADRSIICGTQSSVVVPHGGSVFSWYTIVNPGDSIPITQGPEFLENPASTDTATVKPAVTTTYVVVSNLSTSCKNRDTLTIYVVQDFNLSVSLSSSAMCMSQDIQVSATASGGGTSQFSYNWYPAANYANDTLANTTYNSTSPGTQMLIVEVESGLGCVKTDTMIINVANIPGPDVTAIVTTNPICPGDSTQLGVQFNNTIPASCNVSTTNCTSEVPYTIGTTSSTTAYPTPFLGFYEDGRLQMLIRASELQAAGFNGGKFSSLTLDVSSVMSTQPYSGFTIKMGCSSLAQFPSAGASFQTGLNMVYTNAAYTPTVGLNTFNFTNDYEWDGTSNLLIEFCFDNGSWTSDDMVATTSTSYTSTVYRQQDGSSGCGLTSPNAVNTRPVVTLGTCGALPDPATYSYLWSSSQASSTISNDTIINPYGTVMVPTQYTVVVTDQSGACSDTSTVLVDTTMTPAFITSPALTYCISEDPDTLAASLPGGTWSGTGIVNAAGGVFDPSVAGVGSHWIYYTKTGNCGNIDSVQLTISPPPTINSLGTLCNNGQSIYPLTVTPNTSVGTYECASAPGAILNNGNNYYFSPTGLSAGSYQVIYYVNGSYQCPSTPLTVQVVNGPDITAISDNLTVCPGANAQLDVVFNNYSPASCATSSSNCVSEISYTIGNTNGTGTYPTPFIGFWHDGRMQMLIRASELYAMGMNSGKISSLQFNVTTKASTQPYSGFTVKMGCTSITQFQTGGAFETGLTTVFNSSYTTTAGINVINFTNDYEWDGASNLLIEFCFDNTSYTSNDIVEKSTTTYNSSLDSYMDNSSGCSLTSSNAYATRPRVILGVCSIQPGSNLYNYSWTATPSSATLSNNGIMNPVATITESSAFTVIVSDMAGTCSDTSAVTIDTYGSFSPSVDSVCQGSTTLINITANSTGGTWSVSPSTAAFNSTALTFDPAIAAAGTYVITHITSTPCVDTVTQTITINPLPVINITSPAVSLLEVCSYDNQVNLTATPVGGSWTGSPAISGSVFSPGNAPTGDNILTYSYTDALGCSSFLKDTIRVYAKPAPPVLSMGTKTCAGTSASNLSASGTSGAIIKWYDDAGLTNQVGTGTSLNPGISGPDIFYATQTLNGCVSDSVSLNVLFYNNPVASFTANPLVGDRPLNVSFTDNSTGQISSYFWDFGDTTSSNLQNPANIYEYAGQYHVVLTVTTPDGCQDTASATIIINELFDIIIPNIFTPNSDNKNDEFKFICTNDISELHCKIYDRWGRKVAELNSPADTWNGDGASNGVYYYTLTVKSASGKVPQTKEKEPIEEGKPFKGLIQLVR